MTLQEKHQNIYKEFFQSHDTVLSAPLSIRRQTTGIGHKEDVPYFLTKSSLSMYLGIRKTGKGGVQFGEIREYECFQDRFISSSLYEEYAHADGLLPLLAIGETEGYVIDILVESGRGHGWGFSGTCAALLAHRAYYIHGTHPLTTDISDEYLALALEVQKLLKKGDEKADRIIASSISGTHPLIYIFQNTKNHWKEVEDITYDSLPFDYAVVFSGTPVQSLDATIQKKIFLKSEQSIISALDHAMADLGIKKNKAVSENDIYENYLSLIRQNNSLFLGALLSLTGEKDHAGLTQMIQYMKLSSAALDVVQGYNTFAHDLTHVLEDTLTGIQHTIGIIPIFSGKGGGGYLCIMPFGKGHMVMDNAIQRLRVYHPHATVEYASWLHSPLQTGIVVEQSLTESKFSNYLDEDHQYTYTDNKGNKSVGSLTELKNAHLEDGILLDTIENKIYFKGTKLNSKDITSQTTAIEILTMLLDHAGEDIKNTVFSPSTLTRQYNQMLGKIILPLRKLSKQYFGRELEIETHGTLREFTLTFHEKNISLGIIRKIA